MPKGPPPMGSLGSQEIPWAPEGLFPMGSLGLPTVPSHKTLWAPKGSPPMGSLWPPKEKTQDQFGGPRTTLKDFGEEWIFQKSGRHENQCLDYLPATRFGDYPQVRFS